MQTNDSMCETHHCGKTWVCHRCANTTEALCPACALEHLVQEHNLDKMVTVASEIRSDSEALKAKLGPGSPCGKELDGLKQRVAAAVRSVAEVTREGRAEIGRMQRELDIKKRKVEIEDVKAQEALGELLKRFGKSQMVLEGARAMTSGKTGKLAGKSDKIMKEIKRLLEQAGKELVLDPAKMNELIAGFEQVVAGVKKAHQRMGVEFRSQDIVEQIRSSLAACDVPIGEFKPVFEVMKVVIDQQQDLMKKKDMIKELGESLETVEDEVKLELGKASEQLGKKDAEVREIRRALEGKGEEVKKRIAEKEDDEEKKKPLSAEKGERTLLIKV